MTPGAGRRSAACRAGEVRADVKAIMLAQPIDDSRRIAQHVQDTGPWPRFYFTRNGKGGIARKTYLDSVGGRLPTNFWPHAEVGHTDEAKKELKTIFGGKAPFDTPKPTRFIERVLQVAAGDDALVLDSFAGSGTTAHAAMRLNQGDGGNRRYILVEMMDYADTVTAERVRRVISGYGEGKNAVAGIDSGFSYYELGPALLHVEEPPIASGSASPMISLNADAPAEAVRRYVVAHRDARRVRRPHRGVPVAARRARPGSLLPRVRPRRGDGARLRPARGIPRQGVAHRGLREPMRALARPARGGGRRVQADPIPDCEDVAMELKAYQRDVLKEIGRYARTYAMLGDAATAYGVFLGAAGLTPGKDGVAPYHDDLSGVPRVCAKVPTGGGKTLIGAAAIGCIFDALPAHDEVVVWLVPRREYPQPDDQEPAGPRPLPAPDARPRLRGARRGALEGGRPRGARLQREHGRRRPHGVRALLRLVQEQGGQARLRGELRARRPHRAPARGRPRLRRRRRRRHRAHLGARGLQPDRGGGREPPRGQRPVGGDATATSILASSSSSPRRPTRAAPT